MEEYRQIDSKLFINDKDDYRVKSAIPISSESEKSNKQFFGIRNNLKNSLNDLDYKILNMLDSEKNFTKIQNELSLPNSTLHNHLDKLEQNGLIRQNLKGKKWALTSQGEEKIEKELQEKFSPEDSLFLHLPFLIKPEERFTIGEMVYRASSFYGFYSKHGLSQEEAEKDFRNKLEKTLKSPLVAQYIQKVRYKYEVVCSEEKLLLWRLYSMLHTVLYKSEKKRIGFGTLLYDELIYQLREIFRTIEDKTKDLPEYQRYMIWLMYNGVQLETILPKMEIIDRNNNDIRDELKKRGISLRVYNGGKENETTLIEESLDG